MAFFGGILDLGGFGLCRLGLLGLGRLVLLGRPNFLVMVGQMHGSDRNVVAKA